MEILPNQSFSDEKTITFNDIKKARDKLLRDELNNLCLEKKIKEIRLINETAITI